MVTAVSKSLFDDGVMSSCPSFPFICGSRTVTVYMRGLVITNTHLESGSDAKAQDYRGMQLWVLRVLNRLHENSREDDVQVLAGDFNMRVGDDHCLKEMSWCDSDEHPWHLLL